MSKPPNENTLTLLEDICAHFQNTKDSVQIMSLLYLRMFRSEQACARVLDAPNQIFRCQQLKTPRKISFLLVVWRFLLSPGRQLSTD